MSVEPTYPESITFRFLGGNRGWGEGAYEAVEEEHGEEDLEG